MVATDDPSNSDDPSNPTGPDVAGPGGSGEPPVGRGSVRRVEPSRADDLAPGPFERPADRPRGESTVPRPSWKRAARRSPWPRAGTRLPTTRLGFGCALIAVLAVAWVWVGRGATTESTSVPVTTVTTRARPRVETVAVSVPGWVPDAIAATCGAHRSEATRVVTVDCTPGRGVLALQYRGFSSGTAMRVAYAATSPLVGGSGSPGCERGTHEERSWSAPASPTVPSGRYQCSLVGGHARLVWTSERSHVLATASRDDGDLRSLFQWWTTVPGPSDGEQLRNGG